MVAILKQAYHQYTWWVILVTGGTIAIGITLYVLGQNQQNESECDGKVPKFIGVVLFMIGMYFFIPSLVALYYRYFTL